MPAERSRGSRRTEADGNQLVWTMPVEPASSTGIAFATNVTPVTFTDDMPPLVDAPTCGEFILFPPAEENSAPRRTPHSKKKPENHIPRPPNAFILFRSSFIKAQHVSTEVETNHSTLSKIIGLTWQNLPDDERQVWHAKAKSALEDHKRKYPKYAFRPLQTRGKGGTAEKRKVREVEPKDLKRCAKIAELLVSGKKGEDLDAAIQEFDKHHVPEIITRFEAPITARQYRRSSSAPIPDTEHSQAIQAFLPSTGISQRKHRATSSRPTRCSSPASELPIPQPPAAPSYEYNTFDTQAAKQEPTFDFNSFSFESMASPVSQFECDPLSDGLVPCGSEAYHQSQSIYPSLSVDTSFMDSWSQCSSPLSASMPTTPQYSSPSPPPSAYPSFTLDSFDQSLPKSFGDYSTPYPAYDQHCSSNMGNDVYVNTQSGYTSFASTHSEANMAHLDLDFSAFMNSIPQYAF